MTPDPHAPTVVPGLLGGFDISPRTDPIVGTDRATVEGVELLQYHLPALPSGTYPLTVTQDVTSSEGTATPPERRRTPPQHLAGGGPVTFTVSGVRPSVTDADVYAVYPPDGGTADYARDLPHVILDRSTVPWQVIEGRPWLAVVVFDEPAAPPSRTATVDGLTVSVIDVPDDLRPAKATLPLLAHVRRAADGTERAVVIGGRLPRPGAVHVAHLVSVRADTGPMVTLKSWRFTCTTARPGLAGLLRRLADTSAPLSGAASVPYLPADGPAQDVTYRGSLAPKPDGERPALPGTVAALPAHLAAAWQLGGSWPCRASRSRRRCSAGSGCAPSTASPATPPCPRCPTP
ncbi:hypothetical protein ABT297_22650 [Dactylosporangium sp. NPDC000555]|uniref:hypothetical protein n=1 Tax=Dactylosporangium sp. NPDC000555 TaxID=3154260 RepID=UPI00332BA0E8